MAAGALQQRHCFQLSGGIHQHRLTPLQQRQQQQRQQRQRHQRITHNLSSFRCRAAAAAADAAAAGIIFRQLFDPVSSTYTYLVADASTRRALLIDPVLEQAERDLQVLDQLGLTLVTALNTHCHADHITGTGKLKVSRPGVTSRISAASGAAADILLQPGDVVTLGDDKSDSSSGSSSGPVRLTCLATPGHTAGCMSFYLAPTGGRPGMVFTGDTLLVRGCGRTDFQEGNAGQLYDSVHSQLFSLPDDTLVLPAHDYKGHTASSIGEEKAHNPRLTKGREEFIELMGSLGLAYPKQIDRAVPANLKCGVDFPYA